MRAGAAAICVAPPCDDEVKAEVESYSEEESEMEVEAATAARAAPAAAEHTECVICLE